jgi:hypothetical protein
MELPRTALSLILTQYGYTPGHDPRRLEALLRDLCGTYRTEINVLVGAAQEHIPEELKTKRSLPWATVLPQLVRRLRDARGFSEHSARWAVETWALTLGLLSSSQTTTPEVIAAPNTPLQNASVSPRLERQFETWKQDLFDFSRRNPLLYYRPNQSSSLEIISPTPGALYETLITKGRSLSFPAYDQVLVQTSPDENRVRRYQYHYTLRRKGDLTCDKSEGPLLRTLLNLRNLARASRSELGLNSLFLGLGILKWQEANGKEDYFAPLLLVPAEITVKEGREQYELSYLEEDILFNPTLAAYLADPRFRLNLTLPDFDEASNTNVDQYLTEAEAIITARGWAIERRVVLRTFAFQTIRLGRDLDESRAMNLYPPVLRLLAGETLPPGPPEPVYTDLDKQLHPNDFFQVLDADASQVEALARSRSGGHLVIQGPPGTGKSQTIVNLIAQAIADRKTVLFVSQKKAALDVVYRRLTQAGLERLCLQVHSEKANKQSVLDDLQRVYEQRPDQIDPSRPQDCESLYQQRQRLNNFAVVLNQTLGKLGWSIYQVQGQQYARHDLPDLGNAILNPGASFLDWEPQQLNTLFQAASSYAQAYQALGCRPSEHSWRDLAPHLITPSSAGQVKLSLQNLLAVIPSVNKLATEIAPLCSLPPVNTLDYLHWLQAVSQILSDAPQLLTNWLSPEKPQPYQAIFEKARSASLEWQRGQTLVKQAGATSGFWDLEQANLLTQFQEARRILASWELNGYEPGEAQRRKAVTESLSQAAQASQRLPDLLSRLQIATGASFSPTLEGLSWSGKLLAVFVSVPRPLPAWFDPPRLVEILKRVRAAAGEAARYRASVEKIRASWRDDVFRLDLASLTNSIKVEFSSSIKRLISGAYHNLEQDLARYWFAPRKLNYDDLVQLVDNLQIAAQIYIWFDRNKLFLQQDLGPRFQMLSTDFMSAIQALEAIHRLPDLFKGLPAPLEVQQSLLQDTRSRGEWLAQQAETSQALQQAQAARQHLAGVLSAEKFSQNLIYNGSIQLNNLQKSASDLGQAVQVVNQVFDTLQSVFTTPRPLKLSEIQTLLVEGIKTLKARELFCELEPDFQQAFGLYAHGHQTDWELLSKALKAADELNLHLQKYSELAVALLNWLKMNPEPAPVANQILSQLNASLPGFESQFENVGRCFIIQQGPGLSNRHFEELQGWIDELLEHSDELPAWQAFSQARQAAEVNGILGVLNEALETYALDPDKINAAVQKRFALHWLEEAYQQHPELNHWNAASFEQTIQNFSALDKQLMNTQGDKTRLAWQSALPSIAGADPGNGSQAGILLKEFHKRRSHTPLRQLFGKIPELLLSLKPCVLMSPLSAAAYLPLSSYAQRFDMVIFDEASQVKPAFAVGAMLRGQQVIVAGDLKQLPPTDFFHVAGTLEDEPDEDDENEDPQVPTISLESILDEFDSLPNINRTRLLWHYRSKHEALIQFSNLTYYDARLMTFPSVETDSHHKALHYIQVKGGYDRGKTRQNLLEARQVVDCIAQHLSLFGERQSLGIITLSLPQEQAIREELSVRLSTGDTLLNQYLNFLNEDSTNEEPFFIKALERVQGDERDQIILSIGYGPDSTGKFSQNFGPINTIGGERRLNVAITRARSGMTVVTSFSPADIRLTENSKPGLHDLKRYLVFCERNGLNDLRQAENQSNIIHGEFEDAVCQAVEKLGLQVERQIGLGYFKIDLAVRDPRNPGRYLLGILCDGPNYANASLARDRERLRPEVLRSMGWKLHQVWSGEWYRHPKAAFKKLQNALEKANLGQPDNLPLKNIPVDPEDELDSAQSETVGNNPPNAGGWQASLKVLPYTSYVSPYTLIPQAYSVDRTTALNILKAIVQQEQPIHIRLLYERLNNCFGLSGSSPFQEKIFKEHLSTALKSGLVQQVGSFIYLPGRLPEITPRLPAPGQAPRRIEHLPDEEIAALAVQIVDEVYGIQASALVKELNDLFGFPNVSPTRKNRFNAIIISLENEKKIIRRDESLFIPT